MANFFSKLFGKPSKPQGLGPRAMPYTSAYDDPMLGLAKERTTRALGTGEGIGFGKDFTDRYASPQVAQLQADLPRQIREAQDYYSGAGLGRSTVAGRNIGDIQAQHGRDINSIIAQADLMNRQQEKTDIARYEGQAGGLGAQNLAQRNMAAGFDIDLNQAINKQRSDYDTAYSGYLNRAVGVPLAIGTSIATGNPAPAMSALGVGSGGLDTESALSILRDILKKRSSGGGVGASTGGFVGMGA